MVKWIFAPLVLLSVGAQANGLAPNSSGCVVLDETIYEEVTASGWGITGADLAFTNFRDPSVVICTGTSPAGAMRVSGNEVTRQSSVGQRKRNAGDAGGIGSLSLHRR